MGLLIRIQTKLNALLDQRPICRVHIDEERPRNGSKVRPNRLSGLKMKFLAFVWFGIFLAICNGKKGKLNRKCF